MEVYTIPPVLYRGLGEETHARAFVENGVVRLGNLDWYRKCEDPIRKDPGERTAQYREPLADRPTELVECRRGIFNTVFVLSMSDDMNAARRFGPFIVQINDPSALRRDLWDYYRNGVNVELEPVRYDRHEPVNPALDERGKHTLTFTQKAKGDERDREWRIALILLDSLSSDRYRIVDLGKRLEYCELLPSTA